MNVAIKFFENTCFINLFPITNHILPLKASYIGGSKILSEEQQKMILGTLPSEDYFCEWCGKPFVRIRDVRLHIEHSQCNLGQFHCYVCNKELFSKTGLFKIFPFYRSE